MESSSPSPAPPPSNSAKAPQPKKSALAWWGLIPFIAYVAILVIFGWADAKVRATAPDYVVSYLVGRIVGGLLIAFLIAWIVFRVAGRSQLAATITFSAILGLICLGLLNPRLRQSSSPQVMEPSGRATGKSPDGVTVKGFAYADLPVVLSVPEGWEERTGLAAPIMVASVEPETGNSLGLLAFKIADEKFGLNRKAAEAGLLKEAGSKAKILHRIETKLLGQPAYCLIAETELQGMKISLARITLEKPLKGFIYAVQYSKLSPGALAPESITSIAERVQLKK